MRFVLALILIVVSSLSTVSADDNSRVCLVEKPGYEVCAHGQSINLDPEQGDKVGLLTTSPDGTFTLVQYNIGTDNYLSVVTNEGPQGFLLQAPVVFLGWNNLTNGAFFYQEDTSQVLLVTRISDSFSLDIAFTLRNGDVVIAQSMSPSCGVLAFLVTRDQTNILVTYQEQAISGQPREYVPNALKEYVGITGWFESEDSCSIMLDVVGIETIEL